MHDASPRPALPHPPAATKPAPNARQSLSAPLPRSAVDFSKPRRHRRQHHRTKVRIRLHPPRKLRRWDDLALQISLCHPFGSIGRPIHKAGKGLQAHLPWPHPIEHHLPPTGPCQSYLDRALSQYQVARALLPRLEDHLSLPRFERSLHLTHLHTRTTAIK